MTKIYSNIPVPSKVFRNRKTTAADSLEVGQSIFFCQEKKKEGVTEAIQDVYKRTINLSSRIKKSEQNKGKKFTVRMSTHPETNKPAVGLWRIA